MALGRPGAPGHAQEGHAGRLDRLSDGHLHGQEFKNLITVFLCRRTGRRSASLVLGTFMIALAALPAPTRAAQFLLLQTPPRTQAVPITWFTDLPYPEEADAAKDPCVAATGQIRVDGVLVGTGSLVLNRREVLTAGHVAAIAKSPNRRFTFLLGYNQGRAAFVAEARVVARGNHYVDPASNDRYLTGDWAIAVLDNAAPANVTPLNIYSGKQEAVLGRPLWTQGYSTNYRSSAVPFIARNCFVRWIDPLDGRLLHSCDADKGASGAPLLLAERNSCSVVAIQSGGMAGNYHAPYSLRIANVATSASSFAPAASQIGELLDDGLSAEAIRNSKGKILAEDPE
jgi:V8-like Glu-specific endopeptidase